MLMFVAVSKKRFQIVSTHKREISQNQVLGTNQTTTKPRITSSLVLYQPQLYTSFEVVTCMSVG